MDFMSMTTVSSFLQTFNQAVKWGVKKEQLEEKTGAADSKKAEIGQYVRDLKRAEASSNIHSMLLSGVNLTGVELDYLRKNDPDLYEKAKRIKKERDGYYRDLWRCRGKEEVRGLHLTTIGQFYTEVKNIQNGGMSSEDVVESLEDLRMRMNGVLNDHFDFLRSERYKRLPEKPKFKRRFVDVDKKEGALGNISRVIAEISREPKQKSLKGAVAYRKNAGEKRNAVEFRL